VKELGSRGVAREDLDAWIEQLIGRGELIEFRRDQYVAAAASREYVSGMVRIHRDGFGFLVPDRRPEGLQGDVFLPPFEAQKLMNGDRALVHITRFGHDGKAEGEILKILKRAHATVVGEFRVQRRGNYVKPHDERIPQWIEIPEGMEVPPREITVDRVGIEAATPAAAEDLDGQIVNVEILEFPEGDGNGVGRVIEILGHPDDFGVDVEIMIRKHHLPHRFPPEVIEEAKAIPEAIPEEEIARRRDFREYAIVTIDGETARDFDDAVWAERLPNGNFALQVHIADVSHYVKPGSAIDHEAALRGTSVYFPDRAVPMLPVELSTGICSLRPQEDRLVLSALLELDRQGQVVKQEFCEGIIRSRERMTYTNVHKLLEENDPALRERYQPLLERFAVMKELALILNKKRVRRGSIDFDLPEPLIEFDEFGEMVGVKRSPRNIAHRLIEELMLAANEAVAGHLAEQMPGSIYRIHETPSPNKVAEFEEIAGKYGVTLAMGGVPMKKVPMVQRTRDGRKLRKDTHVADSSFQITSKAYQKLVAQIEGKPEERILSYLMLRSLKQARYAVDNTGHFALAAEVYTHFTSPIRRYPDLIVHRLLRANLMESKKELYSDRELRDIAEDTSFTERRAAEAERQLVEWKKAKFMIDRIGDEFGGMIISLQRFGFFVELEEYFVEGLVPLETLHWDRFLFQENSRQLVGERTKQIFAIGDPVKVRLDRVDASEGRLSFSLVDGQRGGGKRPAKGKRRVGA
jgi:ribonuclease R